MSVVGDFTQEDPALTFGLSDVAYTLGSRWSQLYLTQTVSNTFSILPAQWIVATGKWEAYHPEDWADTGLAPGMRLVPCDRPRNPELDLHGVWRRV